MWTRFMDMHSGGGQKEPYAKIYIEAPEAEARVIFYNRFGHNPERVTCTCCGDDYSISEYATLQEATAFDRNCRSVEQKQGRDGRFLPMPEGVPYYIEEGDEPPAGYKLSDWGQWGKYQTLAQYIVSAEVLVIRADEIKSTERTGDVPQQGYVWQD